MANYYAVEFPTFQRKMMNILSITNSNPMVVTTTLDGVVPGDHDYNTGLIARLNIPSYCGMQQANRLIQPIVVLSPSTFSIDVDSTGFDPFVAPAPSLVPPYPVIGATPATVVPVGEVNDILTEATQNVLPYV
jgi:hypothetical protein